MHLLANSFWPEPPAKICAEFLDILLKDHSRDDFQVRFWDGSVWKPENQPRFTLVLKHPGALRTMFSSPSELTLGEAYVHDDFDIEGDIEAAFDLAEYLVRQERGLRESLDLKRLLLELPKGDHRTSGIHLVDLRGELHSKERDRQAIHYHYDLPAEFYGLWLDQRMLYSSAYFVMPDEDLDSAQEHKLDYICRKLRLRPGERLLDIGCGWGALIMHAAARYGVEAFGVTLSVPQAEFARKRMHEAGLSQRCKVEVSDYRDQDGQYDKIVSVGMFEHVGRDLLPEYFQRVWNLLRPGGVFLNHGISYSATYRRHGPSFVDRYVFPDGDLVPITTSLNMAELSGFELRDVESLREHYALTLHHWVQRLESHAEEARRITSDATYRIWRLYMSGAAHAFRTGRLNLYQALLAKPANGNSGLPLTRADWYV
jgi:cyclopropane-fatty-acyl-phospholipid synthase